MSRLDDILATEDSYEAYMTLVDYFINSNEKERCHITSLWDFCREWRYPEQSTLACSIGYDRTCKERIIASLIYDIFNYKDERDVRDTMMGWAVSYQSCLHANLSPKEIFGYVAGMAPPELAERLRDFGQRDDIMPKNFSLKLSKNNHGETLIAIS